MHSSTLYLSFTKNSDIRNAPNVFGIKNRTISVLKNQYIRKNYRMIFAIFMSMISFEARVAGNAPRRQTIIKSLSLLITESSRHSVECLLLQAI
jgi:acyl-[acyl carrier protein]--UDP-N-acetylglucosamine O-acyltransferase